MKDVGNMNDFRDTRAPLLDVEALAAYLNVSVSTIFRKRCYAPQEVPPAIKIGHHVRWRQSDVDEWLSLKATAAQEDAKDTGEVQQ